MCALRRPFAGLLLTGALVRVIGAGAIVALLWFGFVLATRAGGP